MKKLKKKKCAKKIKPWRANNNGTYYAVSSGGELISLCDDDRTHDKRFEFGNYYRTSSLAVQDAKELALRGKIRQLRDVLCEGFQFGEKERDIVFILIRNLQSIVWAMILKVKILV